MRHVSLSLAVLALAACGSGSVDPDARMPTPYPEGSSAASVESVSYTSFENAIQTVESSGSARDGTWETASINGNSGAAFADVDGNRLVAVFCTDRGEDTVNSLTLRRYVEEGTLGENDAIEVYTSAGARSYQASGSPADVVVSVQDHFANILGAARGDMRIVAGPDSIVIPAGELLRDVVADCRPESSYYAPPEPEETDEEDEDEDN